MHEIALFLNIYYYYLNIHMDSNNKAFMWNTDKSNLNQDYFYTVNFMMLTQISF